ncbi:sterol O-acyltransferase 1 isoform X1 [Vespula squamosa]|uniref:Sterol O-acyltransferase 1 isoform X1 n=1 Tax=Vespula squamosa TaxID=30214 RepID=A0ABD2B3S9_VESSQ
MIINKNEKKKTIDEATVAEIRTRMQEISESIIEQVNDRINDMISEVLNKSERSLHNNSDNLGDKYCDKRFVSHHNYEMYYNFVFCI